MKPEVEDWMIGHNGRWDEDDVHLKNPNTPGFGRMKSHPFLVIFWMIAFIEFTTLLWLMLFLVKGNFPYRWIFSEWICDDMWYSRTKYPHWMFLRVKEALLDAVSTSHHSPHTWGSHVELIWFILGIVPLTGDLGCCGYSWIWSLWHPIGCLTHRWWHSSTATWAFARQPMAWEQGAVQRGLPATVWWRRGGTQPQHFGLDKLFRG